MNLARGLCEIEIPNGSLAGAALAIARVELGQIFLEVTR